MVGSAHRQGRAVQCGRGCLKITETRLAPVSRTQPRSSSSLCRNSELLLIAEARSVVTRLKAYKVARLLAIEGTGRQSGSMMCPARLFKLTAMRGFIKQYADAQFDHATISILEDAFEVAWTRVRASKAPYGTDEYAAAGRAIIATYIISSAKAGERDPRWLADSAILYLSQQKLSRNPPNVLPSIGA